MPQTSPETQPIPEIIGPLNPNSFGFLEADGRWYKDNICYCFVDSLNPQGLEEIISLQRQVWGMSDVDLVPTNILAMVEDTGGSIIIARDESNNPIAFTLTLGATDSKLIIHMIGVVPEMRHHHIGWNLAILLACKAQTHHLELTFDPLRGDNAKLYIEKLGMVPTRYIVDKYGKQNNREYGSTPTDRFVLEWNLDSPKTRSRLAQVHQKIYSPRSLTDIQNLPPNRLIEIPDTLLGLNDEDKMAWLASLRKVFSNSNHPNVIGFATGHIDKTRRSFYVLEI